MDLYSRLRAFGALAESTGLRVADVCDWPAETIERLIIVDQVFRSVVAEQASRLNYQ